MGLIYHSNHLVFGEGPFCSLEQISKKQKHPFYIYDIDGMKARVKAMKHCFPNIQIHYAMKANSAEKILKAFSTDTGVDVVSGGEIKLAQKAGFPANKIIFSGVGKTKEELELAIQIGIRQINVESPEELKRIIQMAKAMKKRPRIAFRINPDVDAETHPYITTGFRENKFGMGEYFLPELKEILRQSENAVDFCGLTLHIGSQLQNLQPLEDAISKTLQIYRTLKSEGYALKTFDVGGGLGINYAEEHTIPSKDFELLENYGKVLRNVLGDFPDEVLCEPGRILVGSCGVLIGEVQYIKNTPDKNFLILNTGIHHLIRPALYQAYHRVLPIVIYPEREQVTYDIVGPICESSDVLGKNRIMQKMKAGEFVAIADAGAYGYAMASTYNEHELPQQFFWEDGKL